MPFQVSGHAVTTKSSRLPHVAGCDGTFVVTAGVAFVAMTSSAEASVTYAAPASPRITAVETPNFFEHVARKNGKQGIAVRKTVRDISPSHVQILLLLLQLLSGFPGRY
jgi:hypothetical protein